MKKSFDAWVEPWIPIEKNDGTRCLAGIGETLERAHEIRAVRAATPTESFGIQRLLITILTDIYRSERWEDLNVVYETGRFDANKISDYYSLCQTEGASFDLFDAQRPFLQYAFSEENKPETKFATNLFDHLPSGNNVPHFMHNAEDSFAMTAERCLQTLCSIPFYEKHKRGKTVTTGINGTPPIYFLFNGNTLFETLSLSMVPHSQTSDAPYGLPIWRESEIFERKAIITPSFLHGLFSAPLKIQLLLAEDGFIKEIIMEQGLEYKDTIWQDPHIAYIQGKKNEIITLKAKANRAVWRDLPVVINPGSLEILFDFKNRGLDKPYSELVAYVKFLELKGTVFMAVSQHFEELRVPAILLSDELKRSAYSNAILTSDNISRECGNALKRTLRQMEGNGSRDEVNPFAEVLPPIFIEVFLTEMKETYDNELINRLIAADTDSPSWEKEINTFLAERFRSSVFAALNEALNAVSDENVDILVLKNKLRNNATKKMNFILKKGGYIDDNRSVKKQPK